MTPMRDQASILPLVVDGLTFDVDGKRLLDNLSFTLPRGGITAIIGPNGAGKSLALRLCHGLIKPSMGSVTWASDKGAAQARRHIGPKNHVMVFQHPVMLRRSALANVEHALMAAGFNRNDRQKQAANALAHFGLSGLAKQPARLMSGGEQQRLAIARAWALSPEVVFLDEPCSQLDPGATRQVEQMLHALAQEGVTLLMATHDLGQARRLAGRIMFLNRGKLVENSPADAFFASPESAEGRAFLSGDLLW